MADSVPGGTGGFFVGLPENKTDEQTQAQEAAAEPKPANTHTPDDYLVGTPENLEPQEATVATVQPQPARELKRSRSFTDSGGNSEEESGVPLTSSTGVNAHNMKNKCNRSDNPTKLSYEQIKQITNDFDEEVGRGASGQVFKGVLENGEEVAVKMFHFKGNIDDLQFENEFEILKRLQHPNIVRLVGFCDEAEEVPVEYNGKLIVCLRMRWALCLEYMPNGNLGRLLHGENLGKRWLIRYRLIKGICKGLEHLQEGLEFPIFHLDLKPDNILLNRVMMPKISDFGLSRLIGEENTKRTLTPLGTIGYWPPEFINYQVISKEYDIYSLGVIITKIIVTGITAYSDVADKSPQEFIQHVHDKWKTNLQKMLMYASLEEQYCKQVKRCIEIARRCMENDRHKRPTIKDIVSQLDEGHPMYIRKSRASYARCFPKRYREGRFLRSPERLDKDDEDAPTSFANCYPQWSDAEPSYTSATEPLSTEELGSSNKDGSSHKDPPLEISHPAHPEHKLKLMTDGAGAPLLCDGCKEPSYGPRYACDYGGGHSTIVLHTHCALAGDPLFDLHTLVLPLFGYGKKLEFSFLHQAPSSSSVPEQGSTRVCDACGAATRGFVYHCSEQDVDLHPCCASLPDRFVHDGRAFDLHRRATRPCALCPEEEGQRRWFWAYRCYVDGDAVDLHVTCLKETARHSWEASYRNRADVGDGGSAQQIDVDGMLENKFGEIAGTVASFITALVFGNMIVKL